MDSKRGYASWVPVESSNLHSVIWWEDGQGVPWLGVRFHHGGVYEYRNVPEHVYRGLVNAESKGKYLYRNVKLAGYWYRGPLSG